MEKYRTHLMLCAGTGCVSNRSFKVKEALERELRKHELEHEVGIVMTGCNGFCAQGPVMHVLPEGIFYQLLTEEEIPHLVEEHFLKGRPVKKLMYTPPAEEMPVPIMADIGFFGKQRLVALRNRGLIDPEKIDEYIARGGYTALVKALTEMTPEGIIEEIKESGLRGRGGAGFPTGKKWELARRAKGERKHIVCNADEGDPGAFMDRSIIESDPHTVLEGMLIGARAIGASQGHIYIRHEYPLARERLLLAIEQAKEYGLLGEDILGTGFDFDVKVQRGAGAFVCGEETSLIASLEGNPPEPRVRPPFPVDSGVWGEPTNINNVETWANVPEIINRGGEWFASIGTETSKGTKVFSVVGKVRNTGLVEVPMGITMREIVFDIGGGIPGDKKFKAVQTGGPSGGCIPERLLDLPIDYERLAEAGSIMGSGGLIVMDEETCIVDVARYFTDFLRDESCGKCTACREGVEVMWKVLERICQGKGEEGDIAMLEELGQAIQDASLCALGGTAPNPVLSTIRYFRDEYEAHIKYKRCPAVVCKQIISSPCQYSCPLDQDAAGYIGLIARAEFEKAMELIREKNPLPAVCGRVCPQMCELKCRAGEWGKPIAIRALKRFVADYERSSGATPKVKPPPQRYEEKVAIIGSGPAGLSAGYFLARRGYPVTIFEALPVPGGMLSVWIPEFRLPKDLVDREIDYIKKTGVEIKIDSPVRDIDALFNDGYKAVLIATGAGKSRKLGIPGEDVDGVLDPLALLRAVNLKENPQVGEKVCVVGGSSAAIDVARTALRLGARDVLVVFWRSRQEMAAPEGEIRAALAEGVRLEELAKPTRIVSGNGKVKGVECVRMAKRGGNGRGPRRPVPVKGSEFTIEADTFIPVIMQEPDLSFLPEGHDFEISKSNTLVVDPETLATNKDGVFAGGEVVSGPVSVTNSIGDGKLAAESIHKFLRGESLERTYDVVKPLMEVEPVKLAEEEGRNLDRPEMPLLEVEQRKRSYEEVELGLTKEMAILEAKRCLRCDLEAHG
ncbi:hydrogenase [candidate division TA06 bacterium DG_24]|jgi:NADH-quinone oxidoreductase subunit F|uniref:Hydrogenase n=3 Tax=Bacteria division TA06 TaxID=1156500 RepID=A0A0S8JNS2_UNCT6|nr:MAG: hydrogenase [candidate division TA06 bacterium DG_24]KPK70608.1 MAG: hydrogenase [candidate division TA06 bacterium SM23_40]KPL10453.1 MAG: hydrogenase [candidate division TA06 bacterium SM1_40]